MNILLILGANSDIAKAYAQLWLSKNTSAKVILASRNVIDLEKFIRETKLKNAQAVLFDATDFKSHQTFYDNLGEKPTEILYAAGVMYDNISSMNTWNEMEAMINVNYTGAVSILNIIACDISNTKLKRIVGVSSLAGIRPRKSNFLYGSTKGAFMQYLLGLNQELSDRGVMVQSINPGFVKTKMTAHLTLKEGLLQTPQQIAEVLYNNQSSKVIYTSLKWKIIAIMIKTLPTFIIKKMQ